MPPLLQRGCWVLCEGGESVSCQNKVEANTVCVSCMQGIFADPPRIGQLVRNDKLFCQRKRQTVLSEKATNCFVEGKWRDGEMGKAGMKAEAVHTQLQNFAKKVHARSRACTHER